MKNINAPSFFSLTLDGSTDVSHVSLFSAIARYSTGDTLSKESLAVLPIKWSTRFIQFFHGVHSKKKNLDMNLSQCVLIHIHNKMILGTYNNII